MDRLYKMKILIVHNFHRKGSASGDDAVVERELSLLKTHGHDVMLFAKENSEIYEASPIRKLNLAMKIPWSWENYRSLRRLIREFRPDIIHVHNFFPLITPSVYLAAYQEGIPLIQSVHDFRFFCPAAFFFRNGEICQQCPERGLWQAVKYRCLRGSLSQSLLATLAVKKARKLLPYISTFIVFTEFSREKLAEMGIEDERLFVKPHFLQDSSWEGNHRGEFFLFAGRLGEEKGIRVILRAWENLGLPLKIAGSGPLEEWVKSESSRLNHVEFLGFLQPRKLLEKIERAYAVIIPSIWYETFGLAVIESYSRGTPVIASRVGALADLVQDGKTGLLFERANPRDLAEKALWLWEHPEERDRMAREAREEFEEKYTAERNYKILMEIYNKAIERHRNQ